MNPTQIMAFNEISIATRWQVDNLGKGYIRYNHF